ncbi:MAG: DUF1801 domain-containing protein [Pseudomonadota bacterium]
MDVQDQIEHYIASLPPLKQDDVRQLHQQILLIAPDCKLWFFDGRDEQGKIVSNPNIGYGSAQIKYVNGESKAFYSIGLSANTTGISIYVMGLTDKYYLNDIYGAKIGKAKVTGYCIKFKRLQDVNLEILQEIIAHQLRTD